MKNTKVKFGKIDKRQAYHFIISFEEDNIDDDTAFKITERFAKEYIGDDYEVIFSVHNNTKHKHGHIIFNSVNIKNGKSIVTKRVIGQNIFSHLQIVFVKNMVFRQ